MELSPKKYALVAMNLPVEGFFTYEVPGDVEDSIIPGTRVVAPFGRRVVTGYVVALEKESPVKGIKKVLDVLDDSPLFDAKRLKFFQWLPSSFFRPSGRGLFPGSSFRSGREEPKAFQDNGKRKGIPEFRENPALRLRKSCNRDSFRDQGLYRPSLACEKVQEGLSLLDPFPA